MTSVGDNEAKRALTERYDTEASAYLHYWGPVLQPASRRLVEMLSPPAALRILDLGAGTGTLIPVLNGRFPGAEVVGADRSEGMLSLAEVGAPRVVMDAADLGFQPAAFDVVVMSFMLFHLPDAVAGLREARRVLRPRGMIGLTTWAEDIESRAVSAWNEVLEAAGAVPADAVPRLANHDLMDTREKVSGLLRSAGFVEVRAVTEDFAYRMEPEDFVALRTKVGSTKQRLESLAESDRLACVARARKVLGGLSAADFTLRMKIILASAEAPPK